MKEMEARFKDIAEVLDFSPVLTQEQLWLAEELPQICLLLQNFHPQGDATRISKFQL